jgi:exopolysaccharide biosynthesis polyprenyl glycosylphosphotransferase
MSSEMNRPRVTRHTSTEWAPSAVRPGLGHGGVDATPLRADSGGGPLQWLLEGRGWELIRPVSDLVATCLATVIALGGVRSTLRVPAQNAPLLALPAFALLLLYLRGLYRTRLRSLPLDGLGAGAGAVTMAAMAVVVMGVLVNGRAPEQYYWVFAWAVALLAVGAGRVALSVAQRWARAHGIIGRPVLIIGAGVVGAQVARRLESHPEYGLRAIGFLDDHPRLPSEVGECDVPVVGTIEDVDQLVVTTGARHLIVAFSSATDSRVSALIQRCQELGVEVSVVPRMFDTINNRVSYESVGGLPLLSFTSVSPRGAQFAVKHAVDFVLAALLVTALSPLMVCVALAVWLTSPGPVFFRQRRVGRDGKLFDLYKFRSMRVADGPVARPLTAPVGDMGASVLTDQLGDATAIGPAQPSAYGAGTDTAPGGVEGTDRRTTVGRFIRRTALDELPQLFNVLRGEMSLVGPRPERPEFVNAFRDEVARYGDRHRVKSGITGWAQVHGLRGNTSLAERVEWDNYYIAHWSLGLDLRILVLTLLVLFRDAE